MGIDAAAAGGPGRFTSVWRACSIAALAGLQVACTAPIKPDYPQARPGIRNLGRIAVVGARFQPAYSFESRLQTKGDEAAWGAFLGGGRCVEALGAGTLAGPFFLVCATVASAMASIGAATTPESPSATKIDAAMAQGQRALGALGLQEKALQAILRYGKAEGMDLGGLDSWGPQKREDLPAYAEAQSLADTLIEVSVLEVRAEAFEALKRPFVAMNMRVRVRILATRDGKEFDAMLLRVVVRTLTLDEWFAGDDAALASAFDRAIGTTAEWALDELLLVHRPRKVAPRDTEPVPPNALRAIEPPVRLALFGDTSGDYGIQPAALDSRQPEFRWEAWPRGFDVVPGSGPAQASDLRYHLRIYDGTALAYERRGLTRTVHRPEEPLEPCRRYRWTVRAHFTLDGMPQVTEWTGAYDTIMGRIDPRWVRREGSAPSLAMIPRDLISLFPIVQTPGADGRACPNR